MCCDDDLIKSSMICTDFNCSITTDGAYYYGGETKNDAPHFNITNSGRQAGITNDLTATAHWYTFVVVLPILGIIGLTGNLISGIVLKKNGLNQPSNILLFALAVADICCLTDAVSISYILSIMPGNGVPSYVRGWKLSYQSSYACFVVFLLVSFLHTGGCRMSTFITVIITLERFIAVFFPLRFATIVTPLRAWLAVFLVLLFWLPWSIFTMFWFEFTYAYLKQFDTYIGMYKGTDLFYQEPFVTWFSNNVVTHLSHLVPLTIVITGCIIISLKVGLTLRARQKLTQSKSQITSSSSRTTKTLLMVCLVFSITRSSYYFQYLPLFNYNTNRGSNRVADIYHLVRYALVHANSAANFFIYIAYNRKFRSTLKDLLRVKTCWSDKAKAPSP